MNRLRRALYLLAASLVATVLVLAGRMLVAAGLFTTIGHHFAGSCTAIAGATRDIVVDEKDGVAFASRGKVLAIARLDHLEKGFARVTGTPTNFRPAGLGLY